MSYSKFIARLVTERRGLVWLAVALLAAASIYVLVTRMTLDSEVLNLLPGKFESVQGLKVYNHDFAQTRELTFALVCQPNDVDRLEEFAPTFAERLRAQPWSTRVLGGSPMETPAGIHDLQGLAVPLLLNLEPQAFAETVAILQPAKLQARLARLHQEIEAGSPRPEFELQLDPLGVVAPALKPFAGNAALEEGQPLTSPDRTLRIFLVVTNQESLDAFACQALMDKVNAFRKAASAGWEGGPLQVLVTGRSAYVAEISLSMRHDIVVTLLGSILLVGAVFFVGFRRWLPLLGMGFSLLLCCLVALAVGLLIFGELNMVTIGMCAILIGLGVDFAILIFGRYQQARNEGSAHAPAIEEAVAKLGRAIFFGALTTSVGFLALLLGGAAGFTQLGVLIAIGILVAGLFMTSVFFLFTRERSHPPPHDWILALVRRYVRRMLRAPALIIWLALPVLLILFAIAVSPRPPIIFDASTKSMEPKKSDAGYALNTIMTKMPTRWEPVIGIVRAPNEEQLHADWQKVETHWRDLQKSGAIKGFSTPAALALSPSLMEANRRRLGAIDFAATRQALESFDRPGRIQPRHFRAGFRVARPTAGGRDWPAADPGLAQTTASHFQLVVFGRSLFCARSLAHGRLRDHEPPSRDSRTKTKAQSRTPRRGRSDDLVGLEFHPDRSAPLVASSAHPDQRAHGLFRRLAPCGSLSRSAALAHPDRHSHPRGRGHDRDHEARLHSPQSSQRPRLPPRSRDRRRLRDLRPARLAKSARCGARCGRRPQAGRARRPDRDRRFRLVRLRQ